MIPKHRVWSKYLNQMGKVSTLEYDIYGLEVHYWIDKDYYINDIDDIKLMQSTGLFDKNGVEIFEGDVVTYNSSQSNYIVSFGQFICYFSAYNKRGENILRLAPGYCWYLKHFRDSFWNVSGEVMDEPANIEVLGNIHEHPELVEGGG